MYESANEYNEKGAREHLADAGHVLDLDGQHWLVHLRKRALLPESKRLYATAIGGQTNAGDVRYDYYRLLHDVQVLLHHNLPLHRNPLPYPDVQAGNSSKLARSSTRPFKKAGNWKILSA